MGSSSSVSASRNPPPEFSSNKAAGGAAMTCQQARPNHSPCNLKQLTLKDAASGSQVSADAKPPPPLAAALPADKKALADAHDLVLEVLSAVKTSAQKFDEKKVAKIQALATFDGGPCAAHHAHNAIAITPQNTEPTDPIKARAAYGPTSPELRLIGRAHPMDNPSGAQRGIFQFLSFFDWGEQHVKELTVAFQSCGMSQANPNAPLPALLGLVRVYRDDVYELSIKGPAIGKRNVLTNSDWRSYSSSANVVGPDRATSIAGGTRQAPTTTTTATKLDPVTGQAATTTTTTPTKLDNGWVVALKRNGVPLDMVDMFQALIKRLIAAAEKAISLVEEIKSAIPKVGVWIECTVSFLEIETTLAWGRRRADSAWNNARYLWIEDYLDFKLRATFVTFTWSLKAGFQASSSSIIDWFIKRKAFELKAIFLVEMKASVGANVQIKLRGAQLPETGGEIEPVTAEGKVEVKAGGEIKVNLAGVALVDAAAGVKLAASLKAGFKIPFDLELNGVWGKTTFYTKFCSGSHISPELEQDLLPGFIWPEKWRWLRAPAAAS